MNDQTALMAAVYDITGKRLREVELPGAVFAVQPNVAVMHQALVRQQANARLGTHKTLTRSEVNRTKAKWFRQKGTGRARHGARSAPIFVGGGVAHGPRPRSYTQRMPRKMRRLALRSALSAKAGESAIAVVEGLQMDAPATQTMKRLIVAACDGASTLVLLAHGKGNVERSIRNLPAVKYLSAGNLNVRDVLRFDRVLIDAEALATIENHLGGASTEADHE